MLESGLYQYLNGFPEITNLVQAPGGQARIYGAMLPKDCPLPAVVYSTVAYKMVESLNGPNRLQTRRMQFSCFAKDFMGSRALAGAVRDALCPPDANGDPQSLSAILLDGSGIDSTRIEMDLDKPFEVGEGGYIFCAVIDVEISFIPA